MQYYYIMLNRILLITHIVTQTKFQNGKKLQSVYLQFLYFTTSRYPYYWWKIQYYEFEFNYIRFWT